MLKDLDVALTGLDKKTLPPPGGGEGAFTMRHCAVNSLLGTHQEKTAPDGDEKARRWRLAMRFQEGGVQDLKPEDLTLLKRLVGMGYTPLIVGQFYDWCDRDYEPPVEAR